MRSLFTDTALLALLLLAAVSGCALENAFSDRPADEAPSPDPSADPEERFRSQCSYQCELPDCFTEGYCDFFLANCQLDSCRTCESDAECDEGDACTDGYCDSCFDDANEIACSPEIVCDDDTCYVCESNDACARGRCLKEGCFEDLQ